MFQHFELKLNTLFAAVGYFIQMLHRQSLEPGALETNLSW